MKRNCILITYTFECIRTYSTFILLPCIFPGRGKAMQTNPGLLIEESAVILMGFHLYDLDFFPCSIVFNTLSTLCILSVRFVICSGCYLFWHCLFGVLCASCSCMDMSFLSLRFLQQCWTPALSHWFGILLPLSCLNEVCAFHYEGHFSLCSFPMFYVFHIPCWAGLESLTYLWVLIFCPRLINYTCKLFLWISCFSFSFVFISAWVLFSVPILCT